MKSSNLNPHFISVVLTIHQLIGRSLILLAIIILQKAKENRTSIKDPTWESQA
ncbi:hypothetical protein [Natranaerobius trueperi]|uniref:hypothetical protein n=1 Tax=Natranaerobius trueperi TaxID=759412 RepID=UPI001303D373|nr:hypothetical protein [Natranaerobius trueperi]